MLYTIAIIIIINSIYYYVHLHHFKKITTNLFILVTILKMLNAMIMSLRRQCLTYQLIRYLSYLFFQSKNHIKGSSYQFNFHVFFSDFTKEAAMTTYKTYNTTILDHMVSHVFVLEKTAKTKTEIFK